MARRLTRCIFILYGMMIFGIAAVCIFYPKTKFAGSAHCENFLPPALLMGMGFVFICGLFFLCGRKCLTGLAEKRYVATAAFLILFLTQVYCAWNYYFLTGWDVSYLDSLSEAAAHNMDLLPYKDYFSEYPNNLFLAFVFTWIKKFAHAAGLHAYEYFALICVQCLLNTATGFVLAKVLSELFRNRALTLTGHLIYIFLIGLSPWVSIPYSDSMGLLLPVLIIYIYITRDRAGASFVPWLEISALSVLGFQIKPQIFIVFLAIAILECVNFTRKKICRAFWKKLAAVGIGAVCMLLLTHMAAASLGVAIDRQKTFGLPHFLAMGLNPKAMGTWSGEDVEFSRSFETTSDRNAANIDKAVSRIKDMGAAGLMRQFMRKTLTNYYNGTFSWKAEGNFFVRVFEERPSPICKLLRGLYYQGGGYDDVGIYYNVWSNFEQMLWMTILLFGCFAVFSADNPGKAVLMLSVIGLTIFELIFEARARYLYTYAPLYIILAVYGFQFLQQKRYSGRV